MSHKSQPILTSYVNKQDSLDTYLHEWRTIRQSRVESPNEDDLQEKDEHGIYTNPEAIWLEKLGFGSYVTQLENDEDLMEDSFLKNAGLSKHHTRAIRHRMNTLRSTVRSRKRKESKEDDIGNADGHTGDYSSRNLLHSPVRMGAIKGTHVGQGSPPRVSPRSSPILSRRTPTSYTITAPERPIRRNRNGNNRNGEQNIDSGVYSASSSRDSTPVRGQQQHSLGDPLSLQRGNSEVLLRNKIKILTQQSSPKHKYPSEHNGVSHLEKGEGVYLDSHANSKDRSPNLRKIDMLSLNLVSKPIDHDADYTSRENRLRKCVSSSNGQSESEEKLRRSPNMIRRHSSDKPISNMSNDQMESRKRETKSMPRGRNEIRPVSPSITALMRDSTASPDNSPEDFKLHFGSPAPGESNGVVGPDGMQDLPNFMITPDALGITRISDLSLPDMEKVRSVALIELTVTFDDHDIPLRHRRPAKTKNYPENALRGVPLSVLLQADQKSHPNATIPLIFEEMISYLEKQALETEGLLRIPGSATRINSLLQELEASFHLGQFSFSGHKPSDVCSLLKQFIRELPVPLLTREYLQAFASVTEISDLKEQVRTLNLLILLLPGVHQRVLKRLLEFFDKITQHSAGNKMDLTNVAMVVAPNLFMNLPTRQTLDDVTMANKTSHIVKLLIKYHNLLWTIPGEMLRQVRYLYENEIRRLNTRSVQKAIRQMQHQLMEQPSKGIITPEVSHHIIRVKAPLFTRVCMAVDICVGVTAGDIITKLQKKSRLNQDLIRKRLSNSTTFIESWPRVDSPNVDCTNSPLSDDSNIHLKLPEEIVDAGEQFLFEVGGNIGERCLPNGTDMYSLYAVNPQAQWVIKPRGCPDLT